MAKTYSDMVSLVRQFSKTRKVWIAEQLAISSMGPLGSDVDIERARNVIKDMISDGGLIESKGYISFNPPAKD